MLDYQGYVLREQVVAKNPNVIAVLNGHYHGASIQIDAFDDDKDGTKERLVYQICTDYQSDVEGGSQYIKFLYFDLKNNKVYMNSYSPYRNDFNYYDTPKVSEFPAGLQKTDYDIYELDVSFDTASKTLSTNRFSAGIYTQEPIGSVAYVTDKTAIQWNNLMSDSPYGWYAKVTNDKGGIGITPIQSFRTARATGGDDDDDDSGPGTPTPPSTPAAEAPAKPKTVEVILGGKPVQAVLNADGSITLDQTSVAAYGGKGFVLELPTVKKAGENPNAYVTVIKKNGVNVTLPLSISKVDTVAALVSSAGTYGIRYNLKNFGDTANHWAQDEITFVTARELFQGIGAGRFLPDGAMTRAMFVTVLAKLDSADVSGYTSSRFNDVLSEQWFKTYVEWAADHGIVSGVGGSRFAPNEPITREQMTAMLGNYLRYKGYALEAKAEVKTFNDSAAISTWAADSVEMIQKAGIISGKPGDVFDPRGMSTRAEAAALLARLIAELVQ